ncbi:unnamed protein product, partial [Porites evermanni]
LSCSSLKFLLLNPAVHFTTIVREARAVVVAGGTMQPMSDFKDQLFTCAGLPSDNIVEFSCGHVIPAENLLSVALDKGPAGKEFDFTFQSRDSPDLKDELGRLLINMFAVVPGGVVCFFSSYDYEEQVYTHWQSTGILDKMNARKKVFREPRKASQLDQVLSSYAASRFAVDSFFFYVSSSSNGAVLFCVVGGKMSEGINFSDDLGRCIVMVGLPYPNIYSPELKEKMTYLDATLGPKAGQTHYENLCMKAVNQSIGRAIRHRGDFATILLLDKRYGSAKIKKSLPGWISDRLQHHARFGSAFATIRKMIINTHGEGEKNLYKSRLWQIQRRICCCCFLGTKSFYYINCRNSVKSFGKKGTRDGEFQNPVSVCVDDVGRVVVADGLNSTVQVLSQDGEPLFKLKDSGPEKLDRPVACIYHQNKYIVSDWGNDCLKVYNKSGKCLYKIENQGKGDGQLCGPWGLCVQKCGNYYNLIVCNA